MITWLFILKGQATGEEGKGNPRVSLNKRQECTCYKNIASIESSHVSSLQIIGKVFRDGGMVIKKTCIWHYIASACLILSALLIKVGKQIFATYSLKLDVLSIFQIGSIIMSAFRMMEG